MSEAIGYIEDEEIQDEGFSIKDDQAADWAIRQIAEADSDLERLETWYANQLSVAREKHDQRVNYFTALLARYMEQVPAKETKTMRKYALPSGEMVFTKSKQDYERDDEAKLLGWCQINAPELVKVTLSPSWAEIKKRLTVVDGGVADSDTGMIVEGVKVVDKPEKFSVKVKGA